MQTKVPKKCSIFILTNTCSGDNIKLSNGRSLISVLIIGHNML